MSLPLRQLNACKISDLHREKKMSESHNLEILSAFKATKNNDFYSSCTNGLKKLIMWATGSNANKLSLQPNNVFEHQKNEKQHQSAKLFLISYESFITLFSSTYSSMKDDNDKIHDLQERSILVIREKMQNQIMILQKKNLNYEK